jgi:hypothetical protein
VGVVTLAISGLLGTKCHLDVGLVEKHKITYIKAHHGKNEAFHLSRHPSMDGIIQGKKP